MNTKSKALGGKVALVAVGSRRADTDMNPVVGEFADMNRSSTALSRYPEPYEVANLVTFLATPDASYISRAGLPVGGGHAA